MRDIERIIDEAKSKIPGLTVEQLKVKFPGDDDGIWFFEAPGVADEVQLESSTGNCPFIIEHDASPGVFHATTASEAVEKLLDLFRAK